MKKTIAFLLVLCMCLSLCACGDTEEPPKPEDLPKYEDTLIEMIHIGDSLQKAEEVFGAPLSSSTEYRTDPEKMKYTYENVEIYGLQFQPWVVTDQSDCVYKYGYFYDAKKVHSAAYENAFSSLKENFTRLYGLASETTDRRSKWLFEDGTSVMVSNQVVMVYDYWINIQVNPPEK